MPIYSFGDCNTEDIFRGRAPTHIGRELREDWFAPAEGAPSIAHFCSWSGLAKPDLVAVLDEDRVLTPDQAEALDRYWGMSSVFFMRLQDACMFPRSVSQ